MVQQRVTFADAAYVILAEGREPLHYKELAKRVLERGLFTSKGKTPEQTLRSQISREVNTKGEESRFVNKDGGMIDLAAHAKAGPDEELLRFVIESSGASSEETEAMVRRVAAGEGAPAAAEEAGAEGSGSEGSGEEPAEDREDAAAGAELDAAEDARGAAEPEDTWDDDDDEGKGFDGTFASAERDPVVYDAPQEMGEADLDDSAVGIVIPRPQVEEDSEQDFLSVAAEVQGEMRSSVYEASMDELAPIVVPPHEGGAAEIARLPQGGRSVLIIKVVRRDDEPQIQLVEELESLVSGVVGRLLLTLPGRDLPDLLDALTVAKKVVEQSFRSEDEDELPTEPEGPAPREAPRG